MAVFIKKVFKKSESDKQAEKAKDKKKNAWIKNPKTFLNYEDTSTLTVKDVIEKIPYLFAN